MILLVDNYDSFVYNLARYVVELGFECIVKRNDAITLAEISLLNPSHIIISPGPCAPEAAGISIPVIKRFDKTIPILGVCLGHQAIAAAYGGKILRAKHPMHGKASLITHNEENIFSGIENPLRVGRYHSLIVSPDEFPAELIISAQCENKEIMALHHRSYPVYGVQFHPESILTLQGHVLIKQFLKKT